MTLEEAIERLETIKEGWPMVDTDRYYEAPELGLEALKFYKAIKACDRNYNEAILPKETKQ
jgi:hypothetical protein